MRSNKDRKLNLGTAFRLTIMNQFVKKNLDVKIHKLCNLANTEEIQCRGLFFLVSGPYTQAPLRPGPPYFEGVSPPLLGPDFEY